MILSFQAYSFSTLIPILHRFALMLPWMILGHHVIAPLPAAQLSTSLSEAVIMIPNMAGGSFRAAWHGKAGRTYFAQTSPDLVNWSYEAEVKTGNNLFQQGIEPSATGNCFVRLVYTDEPTADSAKADFDGDGTANIVELQNGDDPLNPASNSGLEQSVRLNLFPEDLSNQQLQNGQLLSNSPTSVATVSLSNTATAQISSGVMTWGGGHSGSYRGLLGTPSTLNSGRAAICTLLTGGPVELSCTVGFTSSGSLGGLLGTNGMALTVQRSANDSWNRLATRSNGLEWSEMNYVVDRNTEFRTMVRRENDGFSTWIQGGIFSRMGAKVNAAVWFPVSRWKGVNPIGNMQAGIYNSWTGPTDTKEFSDILNPTVDATSALLDYERNKNGLHVPSLLTLPGGELLAAWQNSTFHETSDCIIRMARRNSRGVWGPVSTVLVAGEDGTSNNGPVLQRAGNQIWLTYQSVTGGIYTARKRVLTVSGDTFTLSPPATLFDEALVINHFLTLPSSRIIACWHTHASYWKNRISYSDDGGTTWIQAQMPEIASASRAGEGFAILEADGTLASYWRTDQAAIFRSISYDQGVSWSSLVPTAIPCANMPSQGLLGSRVCGFKRPSDGKIVIIGNNSTTQREKLTVWLVNNGVIEGSQSLLPWDMPDGRAEGLHYPDLIVHPDDSMTIIFARWQGGGLGSAELHSAINTFKVPAAFE